MLSTLLAFAAVGTLLGSAGGTLLDARGGVALGGATGFVIGVVLWAVLWLLYERVAPAGLDTEERRGRI